MGAEFLARRALGIESLEDRFLLAVGQSRSVVVELDLDPSGVLRRAQDHGAVAEGKGVGEEVTEHLILKRGF